jgi:hypothetical protein
MRSGSEYLAALKDDREIYVDGSKVQDVADHQAFAGIVGTIGAMYDYAVEPANNMTYTAPETGPFRDQGLCVSRVRLQRALGGRGVVPCQLLDRVRVLTDRPRRSFTPCRSPSSSSSTPMRSSGRRAQATCPV